MNQRIVRLALGGRLLAGAEDAQATYYSPAELLQQETTPAVVLLDGLMPADDERRKAVFAALTQLRRSSLYYAVPLYLTASLGAMDVFADGVGSDREAILALAAPLIKRMAAFDVAANAVNDDLRVLSYFFVRGDAYLMAPVALVASPWIYEYPAAFLLGGFAEQIGGCSLLFDQFAGVDGSLTALRSSAEWLASLGGQGLLTARDLVDRIRLCPHCHTGKLNFIDTCPLCHSIDFSKKKMIHCFTCGHVAPEETFKNGLALICPRCNASLRHIGSDYDRPVESYICNSCRGHFVEPEVQAECLHCGKKSSPEELEVRQLFQYALTSKAKRAVQLGAIDFEVSLFDQNRNVLPVYFYQVTDWLLQMKTRYPDEVFSLLCIKIAGLREDNASIMQFKGLVDELVLRIRELVRQTDITTSTGANTFWLLLPKTPSAGGEILAARVAQLAEQVAWQGVHISLQVKCFSIGNEYGGRGPVAEALLRTFEDSLADAQ